MTPPTLLFSAARNSRTTRPTGQTRRKTTPPPALRRRLVVVLTVLASVFGLSALALPSASAATPSAAQMTAAVIARINSERVGNGVHSLRLNASLIGTARMHNLNMARTNTMSHLIAGETAFGTRVSHYGYKWRAAAENIAWSTNISIAGATGMDFAMYHEIAPNDGHRRNQLNPASVDLGVDILIDLPHHKIWLTEEFGTPA